MAKLTFTAQASDSNANYPPSNANNGYVGDFWQSNLLGSSVSNTFFAMVFDEPVNLKRLEISFGLWPRMIEIRYADSFLPTIGEYTVLQAIDSVTTVDSNGVAYSNNNAPPAIIALLDNEVSAKVWILCSRAGQTLGNTGSWGSAAMSLREVAAFDTVQDAPVVNPKVPSPAPVSPYTATPTNWTRTDFSDVGTFNFTPREDTVLMLVVAQGAGAGGQVYASTDMQPTPTTGLAGGDAVVSNSQGVILRAPGGKTLVIPDAISGQQNTFENWLQYGDLSGRASGGLVSALTAPAGGRSIVNGGVAGAAWTLASINTNAPATTASQSFTGASPATQLTWEFANGGFRQNSTGLSLASFNSSVTLKFNAVVGQAIVVTFVASLGSKPMSATLNGLVVDQRTVGSSAYAPTYIARETGEQTLVITMTGTPSGTLGLINITFANYGSPGGYAGASGRAGRVFMLPKELTINVPAGGIGQAGGQAVTAAQHGTLGSGGAVGGNGGNGSVIIYEYRGYLADTTPPKYTLDNYNVATAEMLGLYRTDYVGQGIATKQNYVHKLRPRTKNVLVLMSGSGGGNSQIVNAALPALTNDPAIVSAGSRTYTAGSGTSSTRELSGGYWGARAGRGGVFSADGDTIWQSDGVASSYPANTLGIFSSYGSSTPGTWANGNTASQTFSGGSGSAAFFLLSGADLESRTIDIQVPGQGDGPGTAYSLGFPGVVVVYETESDIGPYITQNSLQTLLKSDQTATQITQISEQALIKEKQVATQITQVSEQALIKEKQVATQITQVAEQVLLRENDSLNNPLQLSYAAMAYIIDAPDPQTSITQVSEQVLVRSKNEATNITQAAQQILLKGFPTAFRFTQVTQQVLVAENPSVFWLNFGNLEYPFKNQLYDSRVARATSVPQDAYIQLEAPFAEGSYMLINGVNVGLSSPVKENDQVQLHSGVANFWQLSINVYAYYMTNGEVTREMIGRWNVIQPNLTPIQTRAYAVPYTGNKWQLLKTYYSMANIRSIFTKARMALSSTMGIVKAAANSKLAAAYSSVYSGVNAGLNSLTQYASSVYHQMAEGAKSMITQNYASQSETQTYLFTQANDSHHSVTYDSGIGAGASRFDMTVINPQAKYGAIYDAAHGEISGPGMVQIENVEFIDSPVNSGAMDIEFDLPAYVGVELTDFHFEYNAVGKSYSDVQEYEAIMTTGFAAPFQMGFTDTIAYSVLQDFAFIGVRSGGVGWADIPHGTADLAQVKFGIGDLFGGEKSHGHTEFVQRTPEVHGAHEFHNFQSYPVYAGAVGISTYKTGTIKRTEHAEYSQINWVRVKAKMGVAQNTPYRPAQATNGRGKASLYMGFDTLSDVLDFTTNYSGVTTLQKFNGYVYNLDVDKTFVCEIYYNGPISGLIQGG